jgi:O-methyltransferase/aklanonic acid methyltransferase
MDEGVVRLWERAAGTYETTIPYFTRLGARVVAHAGLEPGQAVLDVACGKGAALLPAARAVGPAGRVLGVDIVPAMVEAAREAADREGLANVTVEVMDGEQLDLPAASFDVVISAFGLGFLRPEIALPGMARVLRAHGRVVLSVPFGGGPNWEFFGPLCQEYGVPAELPAGVRMPSPDEAVRLFAQFGLDLQPLVHDAISVVFPDEETWWRWAWSHGQRSFLEKVPPDRLDAFKADAFAALRSFATPDGIPLDQQFVVLIATR